MKYAFNNNGVLCDVVMSHPSMVFNPAYAASFIEVPDEATNGWTYDGVTFAAPVEPTPTPEQLREAAKQARAIAVDNIKVTTAAGHTFDGDETSQTRMARAITVLSTGYAASVPWVLADNTVIQADVAELTEALAKAGAAQAALWVI
jgi:hypothetical protein